MQSAMLPCTMCRGQKRAAEGNDGGIKYWWILPFLSFFFSLNNQSFWIDECCTALCAMQQGMEGCWKKICEIGGSDAQMAFYYYLLFLWHHLTGAESEWMLRLFNIFWVFLSSWFFRKEPKALVILLISPFFVYYSNELRPYMLQIAASCAVSMLFWRFCRGIHGHGIPAVWRAEVSASPALVDFSIFRVGSILSLHSFLGRPCGFHIFLLDSQCMRFHVRVIGIGRHGAFPSRIEDVHDS